MRSVADRVKSGSLAAVPACEQRAWQAALVSFALAAAAGVLLRFGFLQGLPFGLLTGDLRHAHSHLMFFGWVTPVLMLLLLRFQGSALGRAGLFVISFTFFTALASFVPFLVSGYRMTPLFGRDLPLSMITSGLNGLAWYAFIVLYLVRARGQERSSANRYFLAALGLLFLSSLGAAALAGAGMLKAGPGVVTALATFFLDLFSEGWFGLALLGVAYALRPVPPQDRAAGLGLGLLVSGLIVKSVATLLVSSGMTPLEPLVLSGSALAGLGMLTALLPLARQLKSEQLSLWHVAFGFLALKGVMDLLLANALFSAWNDAASLRVFYLHAYLLGTISLGLVAAIRERWGVAAFRAPWLLTGTVLVMVASLLPLSGAWPVAWAGRWALVAAAWLSFGPLLAVLVALVPLPLVHRQSGRSWPSWGVSRSGGSATGVTSHSTSPGPANSSTRRRS